MSDLRQKCTQFDFDLDSAQTTLGEITSLPRPLVWFTGAYI